MVCRFHNFGLGRHESSNGDTPNPQKIRVAIETLEHVLSERRSTTAHLEMTFQTRRKRITRRGVESGEAELGVCNET